jgi:D-threo-aldose 1-dehydrogenase
MQISERRRLGRTDVEVTRLGCGGAALGGLYTAVDDDAAVSAVRAAFATGVRFFDTAPFYGYGSSEQRFGAALAGLDRKTLTLSTKVGRLLVPATAGETAEDVFVGGLSNVPIYDFSYDAALQSLHESMLRMSVDRIDLVLIHDPDQEIAGDDRQARLDRVDAVMRGAYAALTELRDAGRIGAIGIGINEVDLLLAFAERGAFDCFLVAGRYTLLDQSALVDLLPLCEKRGISIIVGGPYNSGILAGGASSRARYDYQVAAPAILEKARRLTAACEHHGVSLAAAALQFPLAHPAVASVIPGPRSASEARANARFFEETIPTELWEDLKFAGLIEAAAPTPAIV